MVTSSMNYSEAIQKDVKAIVMGAIIGDIVGSVYEFDNIKTKCFSFLTEQCFFTDDTVMTCAVAEAITKCAKRNDFAHLGNAAIKSMQIIGQVYPDCGYGLRFADWLYEDNPKPYNSFGNGAAMRVSAVGAYASTLKEAKDLAYEVTQITHNHPEGLKGAFATAEAIVLAKQGKTKEEIVNHIKDSYYPKMSRFGATVDEIRNNYCFNETCMGSVPEAFQCFLESTNYEDAIRNCISIGGDCDTTAAIIGGVAAAYYGVPQNLIAQAENYLTPLLKACIDDFCAIAEQRQFE